MAEEDGIVVSWSPPNVPSDIIVTYEVTYLSDDGVVTGKTHDHDWRIVATQGDTFSITVTPFTDDSQGDNSNVTAGVDCELYISQFLLHNYTCIKHYSLCFIHVHLYIYRYDYMISVCNLQ